jgi:hypothetical protein
MFFSTGRPHEVLLRSRLSARAARRHNPRRAQRVPFVAAKRPFVAQRPPAC